MMSLLPAAKDFQSSEWRQMVLSGARAMGIEASDLQMELLIRFAQNLIDWNRRFNLTAITDPREVAVKHFLDSMAALPHIPETGSLLDIGSGGGFPGLVISIFRPSLSITSIDSVRKKISFQQHIIRTLGLKGPRALHTRAESLHEKPERYDVVVSRALGSLELFVALGLPLLAEDGILIAYKGDMEEDGADEVESLQKRKEDLSVSVHSYSMVFSGNKRSLVFIKLEKGAGLKY